MDLIKDEEPHTVANYVLIHALLPIWNGKQQRWVRLFLRSLQRTLRQIRRTNFGGFKYTTFNPVLVKKRRCQRYTQGNTPKSPSNKTPGTNTSKRSFKFRLEILKNWSDIIIIDNAAVNRQLQDAATKEVALLIQHKCFDFKSPNFKPSKEY